jgi:putative hemolysin
MAEESFFLVDIDKILASKAGKKAKYVPGFLVSYLKRIVHQEEINEYLLSVKEKRGVPFLESTLDYLDTKLEIEGLENLPNDGRLCTFVSNHPLGGQDGISLGYILGKHYNGKIKYLVNDLLMNLYGLAPLFVPINKTGAQSRDFPKMVEAVFQSDNHIIMFPAGLCSRRQPDGSIRDLEWKKTFIVKSIQTQRDVVPIYFEGRNSDFFYSLANWCKRLGIKFNIEMALLVRELRKQMHKTIKITIGEPISYASLDSSKTAYQWAQEIKKIVYNL